jgi:SH3-like domain-containing protein
MMLFLRRSWIVILLLLIAACDSEEPEQTPPAENESAAATVDNIIPSVLPSPTKRTTATPTLRATGSATDPDTLQVRPILSAVFIRSGPGEGFGQVGLLYEDETARVVGNDEFDIWYEIVTDDGEEGWVAAGVVELLGELGDNQLAQSASPTPRPRSTGEPGTTQLRITLNSAYVRNGPGQNYTIIDYIDEGSTVTVLAHNNNGSWFNIRLPNGENGWIGATVTEPIGDWALGDIRAAATIPAPPPTPQNNCDPAYPTVCIPSLPPDLDCRDIEYNNFTVLPPDPHLFDGNGDGIGCGTNP